jgi:hypothetical protein
MCHGCITRAHSIPDAVAKLDDLHKGDALKIITNVRFIFAAHYGKDQKQKEQ